MLGACLVHPEKSEVMALFPEEPYDPPAGPDLALPLHRLGTDEAVDQVVALLARRGFLKGAAYLEAGI